MYSIEKALKPHREAFIMALAQRYCDGQISWDEYVRTSETVQQVFEFLVQEISGQATSYEATERSR